MLSCFRQISTGNVALLSAVDFCVGMNRVGDWASVAGASAPAAGGDAEGFVSGFVASFDAGSAGAGGGDAGFDCASGVALCWGTDGSGFSCANRGVASNTPASAPATAKD